jgi:hypothetical protein
MDATVRFDDDAELTAAVLEIDIVDVGAPG